MSFSANYELLIVVLLHLHFNAFNYYLLDFNEIAQWATRGLGCRRAACQLLASGHLEHLTSLLEGEERAQGLFGVLDKSLPLLLNGVFRLLLGYRLLLSLHLVI